ncbi:glycosyltransferase [Methylophaga sp.]|uniref:glycosyltransferase n=1 Tax=Methylophaga sp. TaxID=2024840 RepID=UPI003A927F57
MTHIAFLWNNFGPMHADRVEAVASAFPDHTCHGVEVYDQALSYSWERETRDNFQKHTLFEKTARPSILTKLKRLLTVRKTIGKADWFLCHYERPEIFLFALWLRLTGAKVFTMGCSKFDDFPRTTWREMLKSIFFLPYCGAIGSQYRSTEYFAFHGFRDHSIAHPYNTLSIERMRRQAGVSSLHDLPISFQDRCWIIVARLVSKKNLSMALSAYKIYSQTGGTRRLKILGDGPLEQELKQKAHNLGIEKLVKFSGFVQSQHVSTELAKSVALILPSKEEQFGNVVIEAQALGLPVLLSDVCGARDMLVRNWKNGFVFEPDNPEGLAGFMTLIDRDEALWRRLSDGAEETAPTGDVAAFAKATGTLLGLKSMRGNQ